jgi:signal transduction histidine kinase/type II secretory pathway pseudopilin PulG
MVTVILTVVVGLVVVSLFMSINASKQQQRAESAERQSQEQLWASYLQQASTLRRSRMLGARTGGMEALTKAAVGWRTLHGTEEGESVARANLRDEAAALLALPDFEISRAPVKRTTGVGLFAIEANEGLVATADVTNQISVRRISDGEEVVRLSPNQVAPNFPAMMGLEWRAGPKGAQGSRHIAAWFKDGQVAMWSVPDGKHIYSWLPRAPLMSGGSPPGQFSVDGRYLAYYTGDQSPLTIVDIQQGKTLTHAIKAGRTQFSIRPGTKEIAMAGTDEVTLTDFSSGEKKQAWPASGSLYKLTWSGDGSKLAGMTSHGDIYLWNLTTKAAWTLNGHTAQPQALAFSPNGLTLMSSSSDGTTRWWDTERGSLVMLCQTARGISWNNDGSTICYEDNAGGIGEWHYSNSSVLSLVAPMPRADNSIGPFDLSADGRWLIVAASGGLKFWDTQNLTQPGFQMIPAVEQIAFEPSGSILIGTGNQILRKTLNTVPNSPPKLSNTEPPPGNIPSGERSRLWTLSQDGRSMLIEFYSGICGTLDLQGERPFVPLEQLPAMRFYRRGGSITGGGRLTISPDGLFASYAYGMKNGCQVFDTTTGKRLWANQSEPGVGQFSPDSKRFLVGMDGHAKIYQTADWSLSTQRDLPGQLIASQALAWNHKGTLISLAATPQIMQICRSTDLAPVVSLTSPDPRNVVECRLSNDGTQLAVATSVNEISLWNLGALRHELNVLGLDWPDTATPAPHAASAIPQPNNTWTLALWICVAAFVAAVSTVMMLRRHHGLMRDFASAEDKLILQHKDLERANFSLLHSQKMKALGTLAAGMAHDFNNLLSVIRMSNKLIQREAQGNSEINELVDSVETAVLQGKQVVSSMLSYSRAEEESGPQLPIAKVVRNAATLLSTEFLSGLSLNMIIDEAAPEVNVSSSSIEQILLNLIVNASEAMLGNGELTIRVQTASVAESRHCVLPPPTATSYVKVSVQDNGPGIAPEVAQRIFEPFFTTKNSGNERGTGLGLSMVYTIASRNGMGLGLVTALGQGADFFLFLPVRETHTDHKLNAL